MAKTEIPPIAIDLDGGTDIGAAIVDADLFLIDDGAGGTMRKTAASRIKTYAGGAAITWKATNTASLALDNQGDVSFTDLDLTSVTSSDAVGVILSVSMRNNTANEYAQVEFRKNGDTPDYPAKMTTDDSFGANVNHFGTILVGCDTGQIVEYKIDTESSSSVSVTMAVLGYWE